MRPGKKRRTASSAHQMRAQVAQQANQLRRNGISPSTIFFPSVPQHLQHEAHFGAILTTPIHSFKLITGSNGNRMAWLSFSSEQDSMDALLHLRIMYPNLSACFHNHNASQPAYQRTRQLEHNALLFDERLQKVCRRGGIGNTLMFRNVPVQVDLAQFSKMLSDTLARSDFKSVCNVLRIRSAVAKQSATRNFWVVFSGVQAARCAFMLTCNARVHFQSAANVRLNVLVHDDSTDADQHARRHRAIAMRLVPDASRILPAEGATDPEDNVSRLERYLKHLGEPLYFVNQE